MDMGNRVILIFYKYLVLTPRVVGSSFYWYLQQESVSKCPSPATVFFHAI